MNPTAEDARDGPLRVAIVGVGPKGLFALERLLDHAYRAHPTTSPTASSSSTDEYAAHRAPGGRHDTHHHDARGCIARWPRSAGSDSLDARGEAEHDECDGDADRRADV